jgi:hypothetical protein
MKNRIIETLAFLFGLLTTIAGVLTLPQVALLPESLQPYIGVCLALTIVGKNGAYVVLDFADNGKLDKSWRHGAGLLLLAGLLLGLVSCATRADGVKTFLGLDAKQWGDVGKSAGKGAIGAGLPAYLERRQTPDAKTPAAPYVEDWTLSK